MRQGNAFHDVDWERRTPQLVALLAAFAPQLQSLELHYPTYAPIFIAAAMWSDLGRLGRQTRLHLHKGMPPSLRHR